VPKKFKNNDYLFIDTYKSNKIKFDMNEMTVNDRELCVRWNNINTRSVSPEIAKVNTTKEERKSERDSIVYSVDR